MESWYTSVLLGAVLAICTGASLKTKPDQVQHCTPVSWLSEGQKYSYKYVGQSLTDVSNSQPATSSIRMECTLEIEVKSPCKAVLKIPGCQLKAKKGGTSATYVISSNSRQFSTLMSRYHVEFSVNSGQLGEHLIVHTAEPIHISNIKRGILSTLQLTNHIKTQKFKETNIHGTCETLYTRNGHKAYTETDLTTCGSKYRVTGPVILQSLFGQAGSSSSRSSSNRWTTVNATRKCSYNLNASQQLSLVTCKETYSLLPQSSPVSAHSNIKQELHLERVSPPSMANLEESIVKQKHTDIQFEFESSQSIKPTSTDPSKAMGILLQIARLISSNDNDGVPHLLRTLSAELEKIRKDKLSLFAAKIWNCRVSFCTQKTKVFLQSALVDALAACRSSPCLNVVTKAMAQGHVTGARRTLTLYSLALNHVPDPVTLKTVLAMCRSDVSRGCLLPLGIMVHTYTEHSHNNVNKIAVMKVLEYLKGLIGNDCEPDVGNAASTISKRQHITQILTALKTLGNIGPSIQKVYDANRARKPFVSTLLRCVKNKAVPPKVATAALQVFSRLQIDNFLKQQLFRLLNDEHLAVQLRITAYLILMKHPDLQTVNNMLKVMKTEEVKQMRNFMISHLQNLLNSTQGSLAKQLVEKALRETSTKLPSVPNGGKTYSHNSMMSQDLDFLGTNQTVHSLWDTDIIYDPASYVARAANIQVSVQAMGHLVNLAKFGVDLQGLEKNLEALFGNNGVLPATSLLHLVGRQGSRKTITRPKFTHFKKNIVEKLEELHHHISHIHSHPDASLYLSVLGNELWFTTLQDFSFLKQLYLVHTSGDLQSLLRLEWVSRMLRTGLESQLTKALLLPVWQMSLPTGMGLPLNLTTQAAAVTRLEGSAKMNAQHWRADLLNDQYSVDGALKVGGAVDLVSSLTTGIPNLHKTGAQLNIHTKLALNLPFTISNTDRGIKVHLTNLPRVHDAVKVSSAVYLINDTVLEKLPEAQETDPDCFLQAWEELTGLQLCKTVEPQISSMTATILRRSKSLLTNICNVISSQVPQAFKTYIKTLYDRIVSFQGKTVTLNFTIQESLNNQSHAWYGLLQKWLHTQKAKSAFSPPSSYTGMIFGKGHVYTFDGKFYEFPGYPKDTCTYVLARDFVDRSFTILSNKDSVTVLTREIAVSIDSQNRVTVNNSDKYSDLPIQSWDGNVTVTSQGHGITVATKYGMSLSCDNTHYQCTINVSGWYHNRTLGLLGTNDNEPSNDFRKRGGQISRTVQDFVNSYEVSGIEACRPSLRSAWARQGGTLCRGSLDKCRDLFSAKTSPLAACFKTLDPKPFQEACNFDARQCKQPDVSQKVCGAAAAYVDLCKTRGIRVYTPQQCISCNGKQLSSTWKVQPPKKEVDIVLVTSLHRNMSTFSHQRKPSFYLRHIVHNIQHALKRTSNFTDLHFGLVSFAGKGVYERAIAHTIKGVLLGRHNMAFMKKAIGKLEAVGTSSENTADALKVATSMPFRDNAARIIILLKASDEQIQGTTSPASLKLQHLLQANAVTLNVISRYGELEPKQTVGINYDGQILSNVRTANAEVEVDQYPEGEYARLCQISQGAIFDLASFSQGHRNVLNVLSKQIQNQLNREAGKCKQCKCVRGSELHGSTNCGHTEC